jgi:hypothetical protein
VPAGVLRAGLDFNSPPFFMLARARLAWGG